MNEIIKSEAINEIANALLSFQRRVKSVTYDAANPFFKSKYATLAQTIGICKEELADAGLSVSQLTCGEGAVTTLLMHISGQYIGSTLKLNPTKQDPQGIGSAITYARRYAYSAILGIASEEDDDGNACSTPGNGKDRKSNLQTKMESVMAKAKARFKTPDEFLIWRVDHALVEDLKKATESQLDAILKNLNGGNYAGNRS